MDRPQTKYVRNISKNEKHRPSNFEKSSVVENILNSSYAQRALKKSCLITIDKTF